MKRILLFLLVTVLLLSSISFAKEFSDVPTSHWAYEFISKLSDEGVISGYGDGTYAPSKNVTRAEFLKLIVTQAMLKVPGMEGYEQFLTLGANWYDMYVALAENYNPYSYTDEELNLPISRMEVAKILDKFAEFRGFYVGDYFANSKKADEIMHQNFKQILFDMKISKTVDITDEQMNDLMSKLNDEQNNEFVERYEKLDLESNEDSFNVVDHNYIDMAEFDSTENIALSNVSKIGLIKGYDDGTFKPNNNLTRAEVATIIYRFSNVKVGE